jgi:hypothetical protein
MVAAGIQAADAEMQRHAMQSGAMNQDSRYAVRSSGGGMPPLSPESSANRLSGGHSGDRRSSGVGAEGSSSGSLTSPGKIDWQGSLRGGGTHMTQHKPSNTALQVAAVRKSYAAQARAKATTPPPSSSTTGGAAPFMPSVFRPQGAPQ